VPVVCQISAVQYASQMKTHRVVPFPVTPRAAATTIEHRDASGAVAVPTQRETESPETRRSGQLVPRGKNTFLLRVFLGRDHTTGRRRYRNHNFHGNKTAAQKELNSLLRDGDHGLLVEPSRTTVGEYLDQWIDGAAKVRVRPRTLQGYNELLDRYIRPELGKQRLSKLTPLNPARVCPHARPQALSEDGAPRPRRAPRLSQPGREVAPARHQPRPRR